ncbi:hypothetical protein Leryth_020233 [Lithospermum erythrorhizon]|nr:hypothetical protein Leryth_020233 [Lithospermum erythrorhizon]
MMVAESWFRSILRASKKHVPESEKLVLGVLAFEVASLMSKLVQLWQCLNDKQVTKLRQEIASSDGIKKLVSDDDEYVVRLICAEMMDNLANLARAVARISKKCSDPLLRSFESAFNNLMKMGTDPYGWQFTWKKMDQKVKKMEKFIMVNSNLYQEMEMLSDLEQTLRRMKSEDTTDSFRLVECTKMTQKVAWKQHEVKHLKQISLWNRTYDYTVQLLVGSVYTIFGRIGHVFGINNVAEMGIKDSGVLGSDHIPRSHSVVFMQSSVHPSESVNHRFFSGPLGNIATKSRPLLSRNNMNSSYSGPIQTSAAEASLGTRRQSSVGFCSGPLSSSSHQASPLNRTKKSSRSFLQFWSRSSKSHRQSPNAGPIKGSMISGSTSSAGNCNLNSDAPFSRNLGKDVNVDSVASTNKMQDTLSSCGFNTQRLRAPPDSLGAAALALHYANLIIVIEKLAASPHLIGQDARVDVYNMLPASIRMALRAKLKPYAKELSSSVYDTALAREWNEAISSILEWLAPLAHNMIRWQSERSIEHQNSGFRTNVLLVQTLYFANQEKIEAIITELLVGLNYIWRFGREITAKAIAGCSSGITVDDYFDG